ncbi:MAG: type II toxin-antitoxin system VapC family toxin [Balneolales bacterium]
MPQQVLIDTDILIDFALDRSEAVHTLIALEQVFSLSVSVITAMELHAGCRSKKDLKHVDDLLSRYEIQYINKPISEKAYEWMKQFRSSHGVEINDMLIAASAFSLETKLISKNQKHYQFLLDLNLLEYPFSGV